MRVYPEVPAVAPQILRDHGAGLRRCVPAMPDPPVLGGLLALCALVKAADMGLIRQRREDLAQSFEPVM